MTKGADTGRLALPGSDPGGSPRPPEDLLREEDEGGFGIPAQTPTPGPDYFPGDEPVRDADVTGPDDERQKP